MMINASATQRPLLSRDQIAAEAAFVSILRAANDFNAQSDALFKEYGLTSAQYNTLRVLRDAGPEGLSCQEISAALIQRDPDVTRLADRLEDHGLVVKERSRCDRRVVKVKLTPAGLDLVIKIDWPVVHLVDGLTAALSRDEKQQLLGLLEKLRKRP